MYYRLSFIQKTLFLYLFSKEMSGKDKYDDKSIETTSLSETTEFAKYHTIQHLHWQFWRNANLPKKADNMISLKITLQDLGLGLGHIWKSGIKSHGQAITQLGLVQVSI